MPRFRLLHKPDPHHCFFFLLLCEPICRHKGKIIHINLAVNFVRNSKDVYFMDITCMNKAIKKYWRITECNIHTSPRLLKFGLFDSKQLHKLWKLYIYFFHIHLTGPLNVFLRPTLTLGRPAAASTRWESAPGLGSAISCTWRWIFSIIYPVYLVFIASLIIHVHVEELRAHFGVDPEASQIQWDIGWWKNFKLWQ